MVWKVPGFVLEFWRCGGPWGVGEECSEAAQRIEDSGVEVEIVKVGSGAGFVVPWQIRELETKSSLFLLRPFRCIDYHHSVKQHA